jgi:hypothetical protein
MVEWIEPNSRSEDIVDELPCLIYCDRVWGSTGAGAMVVLISPSGIKLCYATRLKFTNEAYKCMNNITKYEAILLRLHKLRVNGA